MIPPRATLGLLGAGAMLVAGLSVAGGGRDLARLDPLLSLCLAARPGVTPADVWSSWSLAPQIVLPLLLAALAYGRGWRAGRPTRWQAAAFAAGAALLVLALVSPLCRLAASLASAHMVQHVLIVAVVPPLLIMSRGLATVRQGLRAVAPREPGGWLDHPGLASAVYALAIWLSHAPVIYEAALLEPALHLLLLASQLGAGLWFWQVLLGAVAATGDQRARSGGALLMAFSTFMHTSLLGALLSFAGAPWYPLYELRPQAWGVTPLADQQLAGVIMWVPMSAVYLAAGLAAMARLLEEPGPRHG
jgi:putative membrane protein